MKKINVTVTGAAGQIGYALLFRIASGQAFGADTQVNLNLVEIEPAMTALEGVHMELNDCAFPLLKSISLTSDINEGFKDSNWCILVGSFPRKKGMERNDLLKINGGIFTEQGKAINDNAAEDARILVIGNPCNTNCLIAMKNAPRIPRSHWFAMTALDENRAKSQLAMKAGVHSKEVTNMTIWGNHSSTQYPDFFNAKIGGQKVADKINDIDWLKSEFITTVQQRGAAIIEKRGSSSAASAANAAIDTIQRILRPTSEDDWFSVAVPSDGSYGIPEDLVFGFPLKSDGNDYQIVQGIEHEEFGLAKIKATREELEWEKNAINDLIR